MGYLPPAVRKVRTGMPLPSDSKTEATGGVMQADRRQSPRYVPNDDVFVIFSPNYTRLGKLKDVSSGGVAFEYAVLGEDEEILDSAVDIFASKPDRFLLSRVPCRVVYDTKTEKPTFGGIETRRCGLKFEHLSQKQSELLNLLLVKSWAPSTME
jgi:hypothetical protein